MTESAERQLSIHQGAEARRFLDDPLWIQAVNEARTAIYKEWYSTRDDQAEERERLFWQQKGLDKIIQRLTNPIDAATLAEQENKLESDQRKFAE